MKDFNAALISTEVKGWLTAALESVKVVLY